MDAATAPAAAPAGASATDPAQHVAFVAGILLAALDLSDTMVFPFLGGFFMAHGVSQGMVGLIFALLSVGITVMVPFMSSIFAMVDGPARALGIGAIAFGGVRALTALLPFVPNGTPMLVCSSVIFFFTGCVYAVSEVGALSWVLLTAATGQKVGAMATLVSSRAIGSMLGTPVGGILFDLIGWSLTNIVGSAILFVPLVIFRSDFIAPLAVTQQGGGEQPVKSAFRDPKYIIANALNLIAQSGLYMIAPYLQLYFADEFGTPKWVYGLIVMSCVVFGYMGGSALSVKLENAFGYRTAIFVGLALFLLGYLLLGPSPLLGFLLSETDVWMAIFGLAVMLAGDSILVVLSPAIALKFARECGLGEEEATIQTASLSVTIMAIGLFLGPVSGSALAEAFGVPWTNTILGLIGAVVGVVALGALWLLDSKEKPSASSLV